MKKIHSILFVCLLLLSGMSARAAERQGILSESYGEGDFKLFHNNAVADIYVDEDEQKVVLIAAADLAADIERVTGKKPAIKYSIQDLSSNVIIIGTTKSRNISELEKSGKLDTSHLDGQWETFVITTVAAPVPGVENALVIAGSDRRGTAFGVYELSRQIGVSPWYWWADVPPEKKDEIIIKKGAYKYGPPSVKYRGVFLNDEDAGLQPWAAKTFEPETGDIGPKTYAKIFELLLRLKANHIWPAMHKCTRAFNYYDKNKFVADDYAIVMGSSHCEQMLRNNVDEWKRDGSGTWDYQKNREGVRKYWEKRVSTNRSFENVYTLGMRGIHDSGMIADGDMRQRVSLLETIIREQREMLGKWVRDDVTKVPQIFCPYKEVLEMYRSGLTVPDDVTLLWPDDNFGYIRQLSTPEEQKRSGGSGVYYHISYCGMPHDYLWLNTTPPALIWYEMRKAWDYNARELWMVNVGDIKPGEIGMEFFLQMAWDIDRWSRETVPDFLAEWAGREFGEEFADDIAEVLQQYYLLNYRRKPEHMGFNEGIFTLTKTLNPDLSLYNYGDEAKKRLDAFAELNEKAEAIYEKIPASMRDAYYQLVLYPVRASNLMNQKFLYAFKSRKYAKQGRTSANAYANRAKSAFKGIKEETDYYNQSIAGGKWNEMMSDEPYSLHVFGKPKLGKVAAAEKAELGVIVEGQARQLAPTGNKSPSKKGNELPAFNRFTNKSYFIDLFNKGTLPFEWEARPSADWIRLSSSEGSLELEERIWVEINYAKAPKGNDVKGNISISGAGAEFTVDLSAFNPESSEIEEGVSIQDNGAVSINAENWLRREDRSGAGWRIISGLGRTGGAVAIMPTTMEPVEDNEIQEKAPVMKYPIYIAEPGSAKLILQAIPTHEINEGKKLRCAVSVDDGRPVLVDFVHGNNEHDQEWKKNVLRNTMEGETVLDFTKGPHELKIWGIDPSVALDKILIDFGGLKKSYLGPPETTVEN